MLKGSLTLAFLIHFLLLLGQGTLGVPFITNIPHEETMGGAQNWQMAQGKNGNMYFGNNFGLLRFNGRDWKLFVLPNHTFVRSLFITEDDRIYVGGQDELGFFFPNRQGTLEYYSLIDKISEKFRAFGDVWYISYYENDIFFNTTKYIFQYKISQKSIKAYEVEPNLNWTFMGVNNKTLFAHKGKNIFCYKNESWVEIPTILLHNALISHSTPCNNGETLLTTRRNGVYMLNGEWKLKKLPIEPQVISQGINKCIVMNDSTYIIGTISNGVYIIHKDGTLVQHFYSKNGLQNDNVRSLYIDANGLLWLGLDEGISIIHINEPTITHISPENNISIPIYTSKIYKGMFLMGTSDGIFSTSLYQKGHPSNNIYNNTYKKLPDINGQVWNIEEVNGRLFMGHHDGVFELLNEKAHFISKEGGGTWKFRGTSTSQDIITGMYSGLQYLEQSERGNYNMAEIANNTFKESFRFLEIDDVNKIVWTSHPYRGIYRFKMDDGYKKIIEQDYFTTKDGLPQNLNNYVFKINGNVVFATEKGIYRFDTKRKRFVPDMEYKPIFGNIPIKYIVQDNKQRIWFVKEKSLGVVDNGHLRYFPEFEGKLITGFEHIYPYNDENIFVGSYSGLMCLNYKSYIQPGEKPTVSINRVMAGGIKDSLLFDGYFISNGKIINTQPASTHISLTPDFNTIHVEFSSMQGMFNKTFKYSFRLKGLESTWSLWSEKNEKEYTNLSYGNYVFEVMAQDNLGNQSDIASYEFFINPKWYQTKVAYILYICLFLLSIYLVQWYQTKRLRIQREAYEEEQRKLKYLHELEIEHNEREIITLKNAHLESEISFKNKELASATMHLYKRGRLLGKIKQDLISATQKVNLREEKADFLRLQKLIHEEEKRDNDWEQFAIHFDDVHNRFLERMKTRYPELSSSDLKVLAYIKMNLSSKEIAQLLNITVKGVEVARYRLRKKLQLPTGIQLSEFVLSV